jgi:hypothetical protein
LQPRTAAHRHAQLQSDAQSFHMTDAPTVKFPGIQLSRVLHASKAVSAPARSHRRARYKRSQVHRHRRRGQGRGAAGARAGLRTVDRGVAAAGAALPDVRGSQPAALRSRIPRLLVLSGRSCTARAPMAWHVRRWWMRCWTVTRHASAATAPEREDAVALPGVEFAPA